MVHVLDRVGYAACLERQRRSHILLLLQGGEDTRTLIPAKAFEYLRIGRPILAVVPESASSELFHEVGGARIVGPEDRDGMLVALRDMIQAARAGEWGSSTNPAILQAYARRRLTARLGAELDLLLTGGCV